MALDVGEFVEKKVPPLGLCVVVLLAFGDQESNSCQSEHGRGIDIGTFDEFNGSLHPDRSLGFGE